MTGTQKLLSNIVKVVTVCVKSSRNSDNNQTFSTKRPRSQRFTAIPKRKMNMSSEKYCHICSMKGHLTRD